MINCSVHGLIDRLEFGKCPKCSKWDDLTEKVGDGFMDEIELFNKRKNLWSCYSTSSMSTQEGGDHYKNHKIQPMEYNLANSIPFAEGSVIKYVTRWRDKGGIKDLKKARHVLDILIEHEENLAAKP